MSKLAIWLKLTALLMLLHRLSTQTCNDEIVHDGYVCDISNDYSLYFSRLLFCLLSGDAGTLLDYCKIAACNTCNESLNSCVPMINTTENDNISKLFLNNNNDSSGTVCVMTSGENCYRSEIGETYFVQHYKDAAQPNNTAPSCCMLECVNRFDPSNQAKFGGCGTDGQYYSKINDFCNSYCKNRTISFSRCGTSTCGVKQGCPTECMMSFPNKPVCSNTFTLYTSADKYCADLGKGVISSYSDCGDVNCTQGICDSRKCAKSFTDAKYAFKSVCSRDSHYYKSIQDYCLANSSKTISSALLCNSSECTQKTCCLASCLIQTKSNFCLADSGTLVTPQTYCANKCNNVSQTYISCKNVIGQEQSCTQNECIINYCLSTIQGIPDDNPVCGNNNILYASKADYCIALNLNPRLALVKCGDASCATKDECCYQNCVNSNTNFQPLCDSTYKQYVTVNDFCKAQCDNPNLSILKCGNGPCTLNQCCMTRCKTRPFKAVCSINASVTFFDNQETFCKQTCSDRTFITSVRACEGDCTAAYCQLLACTMAIPERTYCGSDGRLYSNAKDYCTAKGLDTALNETLCANDQPCTSSQDCCKAHCLSQNPEDSFQPRCGSDFTFSTSADQYCDKFCSDPEQYYDLRCGPRSELCDEDECCVQKCMSQIYERVCSESFEPLTKREYCENICTNPDSIFYTCSNGCTRSKCENHPCLINPRTPKCRAVTCRDIFNSPDQGKIWVCANDNNLYQDRCEIRIRGLTELFACKDRFSEDEAGLLMCRRACSTGDTRQSSTE